MTSGLAQPLLRAVKMLDGYYDFASRVSFLKITESFSHVA